MLLDQLSEDIKAAMRSKDQVALRSLRLIKSALMLLHSEGGSDPSSEDEMSVLVKMAKQRRDAIEIYNKEGREDLASKELEELAVIENFLPQQLNPEELKAEIAAIIAQVGASSMQDMGKVMGMATQKLKGRSEGKAISNVVRELLA